jgi:cytoskeleton protein RodZ
MQTIGERLEEARKRKGISIREASEATKIRSDYLQKFETNAFEIGLPDIYVRGFLRSYSHYLKLNPEKLLTDYASLGFGEPRDSRRHQEQREIIGRIDLPETSRPEPPAPPPPAPNAQRAQPTTSRSMPTAVVTGAPSADRRQKIKLPLLVGGAVLALLILVFVIHAILSDSAPTSRTASSARATTTSTTTDVPDGDVIRLIALDNVQVKVIQLSTKQELFSGDLIKGDTRYIRKDGKVSVSYNPGKNLQVEVKGQRFKMTVDGAGQNTIQ